jgi:acetylornithine deacetylase/succinyl-diaminopimelate desuccinylase-like protein
MSNATLVQKRRKPSAKAPAKSGRARGAAATGLDVGAAQSFCDRAWEREILPKITDYIRIPNKSPYFDKGWREAGHMDRAVALIEGWCRAQPIPGLSVEVVRLEGRTPVIFMEIPGSVDDTVLLYGHLDKQPEFDGWRSGLGPWTPVREGDRLYGRGGADDGYAAFASLTAIRLLAEQQRPHARCVVVIEACEESGSYDLPAYIEHLRARIGEPSLVVCLDSGCGNYDQLWCTTSLRGIVAGNLRVQVLREGVHSGDASGIVPSSFRVLRQVLSRVEDENSGRILLKEAWIKIPRQRLGQAKACAKVLGKDVHAKFPWAERTKPYDGALDQLILNRTWRPYLAVTGVEGVPSLDKAGNVLRPFTTVKLSLRIPPRVDPAKATAALKKLLEKDPPYGASVVFNADKGSSGWDSPAFAPWLSKAIDGASSAFFGRAAAYMGEGGTIPFMAMLGAKFPDAQFMITGLLGPGSNAHGPNEFLHVPTGKKLTACVASVLDAHAAR